MSEGRSDSNGRIAKAILGSRPDRELVEELYVASLSRPPTPEEVSSALKYLQPVEGGLAKTGRAERAQDLLWALVNSKAFLYNH